MEIGRDDSKQQVHLRVLIARHPQRSRRLT